MYEPERVSVIVPVFNVKEYLREALDSLLAQTYRNLEIVVVDDGSTDGSGKICDEYARKDERFHVIHQENRGLSGARNTALEIITGQYVMFLDSDDAWHPDMARIMVETQQREQADMVMCRFALCPTEERMNLGLPDQNLQPLAEQGWYNRVDALHALADGRLNYAVWNKIYRRELWECIRFPEGRVYEDILTDFQLLNCINNLYILDDVLYLQRIHSKSITVSCTAQNIQDYIYAVSQKEKYISRYLPEVFSDEHLFLMKQAKLYWLIDKYYRLYPKNENERRYAKELKQWILDTGRTIDWSKCALHNRCLYQTLRFCPGLMKKTYHVYLWVCNERKTKKSQ